ncbi:MAG: FGLLP motif-containing membrane protein [Candidatus Dormiibacterota bacterium]
MPGGVERTLRRAHSTDGRRLGAGLAIGFALWLAGVSVASASAPTFNINGTWSITEDGCRSGNFPDGTLVVSGWNSTTGTFEGMYTRGSVSRVLDGSESGDQLTISDPTSTLNRTISGPVTRSGSSLTASLAVKCTNGAAGTLVLLNSNPVASATASPTPHQSGLAAATVERKWRMTVTVTKSHSGASSAPPDAQQAVGHTSSGVVWLQESCPSTGSCTLLFWGPDGPGDSSGLVAFDNNADFTPPAESQPLTETSKTFHEVLLVGGYGGRFPCSAPYTPPPQDVLTLTISSARTSAGTLVATGLTGDELETEGWSCDGTTDTGWRTIEVSITAHPVGKKVVTPAQQRLTVSTLAASLNPPGTAFSSPGLIAANIVITAALILFITFPSAVFNHTLQANYEEIREFGERRVRLLRRVRERADPTRNRRRELAVFAGVLLVGGILNGLLNPKFGLDGTSVVTYLATLGTLCFGVAVPGLVAHTYRRARQRDRVFRVTALPVGLGLAGLCVLVSRLTGFEPGYFYGLVCGVVFGSQLPKHEAGHTAALATFTTMLLTILAWIGWTVIHQAAASPGAAAPVIFIDDFLASVFVGGLVGNVVGLLPLRFLNGGTLAAWHRGVWVAVFGLATFLLIQVLLHPTKGAVHPSTAPVVTAVILFVGFGGASLAVNRYFAWSNRPTRLPEKVVPVTPERASGEGATVAIPAQDAAVPGSGAVTGTPLSLAHNSDVAGRSADAGPSESEKSQKPPRKG